ITRKRAFARWEVVGVDASAASIETARFARYEKPAQLPATLQRMFVGGSVAPSLSSHCRFVQNDLLDGELPRKMGLFDAIVCRNLLIYFREEQAIALVSRLAACLEPEGRLLVARAETPLARRSGLVAETDPRAPDVVFFRNARVASTAPPEEP